jgi:hypothetical protein
VNVNNATNFQPELFAKLTVEGKDGSALPLTETGNGQYINNQLNLVIGSEYRLRIKTVDNKEYLSDYVIAKQTPPIDSITWNKENGDLFVNVNTHDDANATKYYKWAFGETWEIHSHYLARYQYIGGTTIIYAPNGYHNLCWKSDSSTSIILASSTQLSKDVISQFPIQIIPKGSDKLSVRYSIFVKQQSLTKEAYEYLQLMKKNTESIGTIFDSQPSELRGNIHCISNPDIDVIGFISASSFSEKRFFITAQETNWPYSQDCEYFKVRNNPDSIRAWVPSYLPWEAEMDRGLITYYFVGPPACVDCVLRGGSLTKPTFW